MIIYLIYNKFATFIGEDDWDQTDPEDTINWTNITNLEPGETYELRVVAVTGAGGTSYSTTKSIISKNADLHDN